MNNSTDSNLEVEVIDNTCSKVSFIMSSVHVYLSTATQRNRLMPVCFQSKHIPSTAETPVLNRRWEVVPSFVKVRYHRRVPPDHTTLPDRYTTWYRWWRRAESASAATVPAAAPPPARWARSTGFLRQEWRRRSTTTTTGKDIVGYVVAGEIFKIKTNDLAKIK